MFTWIGKQRVRSSEGFEVQSIDRFSIAYREGSQTATVYVEPGSYGGRQSVQHRARPVRPLGPPAFDQLAGEASSDARELCGGHEFSRHCR